MAQVGPIQVGGKYASGATLGAYPKSNWLQSQLPPSGAPQGSATATGTVSGNTTITITGLANGTDYFVTDSAGAFYMSATTPALVIPGELGYAEITANQTFTTADAAVTGLVLSNLVIPADRPVLVTIYCPAAFHGSVNGSLTIYLTDNPETVSYAAAKHTSATVNAASPLVVEKRFAAGVCPANLQARAGATSATGTLGCGTGAGFGLAPAYIQAVAL